MILQDAVRVAINVPQIPVTKIRKVLDRGGARQSSWSTIGSSYGTR